MQLLKPILIVVTMLSVATFSGCRDRETTPADSRSDQERSRDQTNPKNGNQTTSDRNSSPSAIRFTRMTETLGLDFVYRNGGDKQRYTILESLGGGVGVMDFDADGFPDLFLPGGGTFENDQVVGFPSELYRNFNGLRFESVADFAGDNFGSPIYTHGAKVADFDADGFDDVLVTGYGGVTLWKNQGDGTLMDATPLSGIDDRSWSSSAGCGDFNGDGLIDLYLAHYVNWSFDNHPFCRGRTLDDRDICPPREYEPLPDAIYLANPDGTFRNATESAGLRADGKGLGVLIADFDGDGHTDIYVANDTTNNFLYINDGNATFREVAMLSGVAADKIGIPNGSMGVDLVDFDNSGRPDIWVTNYEREDFAIYRNEGGNAFLHVSDICGVNLLGGLFVGFGTVCEDFDFDGDEDIMVNNGHVILFPTASPRAQTPLVLENYNRRFQKVLFDQDNYLMQAHEGRGLALFDYDRDGDLDAVFSNLNAPAEVLRNDATPIDATQGNAGNNWVKVELIGRQSNREAIGAVASLGAGEQKRYRHRKGASSYLSSSERYLTWGVGEKTACGPLTITWPGGRRTMVSEVKVNELTRIVEPPIEE